MTEAPDVYPEFPDDDGSGESGESGGLDDSGVEGGLAPAQAAGAIRTSDPRVDAVLDSLRDLDERPVAEHAAVFERAHEELRAALDPDRETA